MANYRRVAKAVQPYRANCGDDVDDDDDVDLDDDIGDGYDGLTDYDEDLDYPESADKHEQRPQCSVASADSSVYTTNQHSEFVQNRSLSESCPRVLEHVDDNRKDHHNHLERRRRASIKGSYNDLREAIPALRGSKASRAVTLQRAVEYIEELKKRNAEHTQCVDTLTRQNEHLDRQIQDLSRNYQRMEENEYSALSLLERGLITTISPATYNQPESVTSSKKSRHFTSTSSDANQNEFSSAVASSNLGSDDAFRLLRVVSQGTTATSLSSSVSPSSACQTPFSHAFSHFQKQLPSSASHYLSPSVSSTARYGATAQPPHSTSIPDNRTYITPTAIVTSPSTDIPSVPPSSKGKRALDNSLSFLVSSPMKAMKYTSSTPGAATQSGNASHYTTLNNVILSSGEHPLANGKRDSVLYQSTSSDVTLSSIVHIDNASEIPDTAVCGNTYLASSAAHFAAKSSSQQNGTTTTK